MIYGDVVFDLAIGGTILSTEELFAHLADEFKPSKIILAGNETGVFSDFPKNKQLVPLINHENIRTVLPSVKSAAVVDVTGGMLSKLDVMWHLCEQESDLTVYLFSATKKNTLKKSLLGSQFGTKMQY